MAAHRGAVEHEESDLAEVLEAAMGWLGGHLNAFEAGGVFYEVPHGEAAEVTTEAAGASQRRGGRRAASALFARAGALAASCEGARTLALATPASFVPVTTCERDIATFAARGESSKNIAERLYLSVRTVDNRLQNVYGKLGVTGRREVARALADVSELSPETPPPGHR